MRINRIGVTIVTMHLWRLFFVTFLISPVASQLKGPMTCNTVGFNCQAYLYYRLDLGDTLQTVATLFNVQTNDIDQDGESATMGSVLVSVNCSCSNELQLLAFAPFKVTSSTQTTSHVLDVNGPFKGLAYLTDNRSVNIGQYLSVSLYCGCANIPGSSLLSYVVQNEDTLNHLTIQFKSDLSQIVQINNVADPQFIQSDIPYYIPVPNSGITSASTLPPVSGTSKHSAGGIPLGAVVGIAVAAVILIAIGFIMIVYIQRNQLWCYKPKKPPFAEQGGDSSSDFSISRSCVNLLDCTALQRQSTRPVSTSVKRPASLSREMMNGVFGEKPVVFTYEEVAAATEGFKDSCQIGRGAFGSVYFGLLREQEVAIKKMKATKSKEFLAELKVLCKVHHTNLVELIGYSVTQEDLFLVYEYAENKAVSDRLHDPLSKGYTPLSWNARVQIALDAARGLEYIHEHTKSHYVHRDVKTSNILLDAYFRAKVADFGLAKLVEQSADGEATTTRVVGTFGYLAPEYLRDGQATSKSDVYAFGVVLFELITGQEAISRKKGQESTTNERRSLISIMLGLLEFCAPYSIGKLKACVDPHLEDNFPQDCVYRMAMLGRMCVEEDPSVRPNMKDVVFTLSQILLSSIEWEATLAGNSQVFSGLLQGR